MVLHLPAECAWILFSDSCSRFHVHLDVGTQNTHFLAVGCGTAYLGVQFSTYRHGEYDKQHQVRNTPQFLRLKGTLESPGEFIKM